MQGRLQETLGWLPMTIAQTLQQVVWKCSSMDNGGQFVRTISARKMEMLLVDSWDMKEPLVMAESETLGIIYFRIKCFANEVLKTAE